MTLSLENIVNQKIAHVFNTLSLDVKFAFVKNSDRPDLSDFQCNGALALAKAERKNPREIATLIAAELEKDKDIAKVSVDGPGFINISLSSELIAHNMDALSVDARFGVGKVETPQTVVMDFGGPNVAKALHVGHLRSAVIGESIRRIEEFVGNKVISDVHFGDWGTPMGMILAEIISQDGNLSKAESYDIEAISNFYKKANIRCKEDETAKETARVITAELQNGNPEYRKAWQHLRKVSVDAVKKNYDDLEAHFDLWLGESDAHQACSDVVKIAADKGISEIDDGATIIRLEEENKPKPPVILVKSDGGFAYQVTDIATVKMRVDDLKAAEIIYVVDKRQSLHFEQVFEVAEKLGLAPNVSFKHVGFGTVNGADGKPFKTRDGGVMNLEDLIAMSKDKVRETMPEPTAEFDAAYIENLVSEIAIGAIKFQDLKNNTASGYVFELDDFAKFEGKTGPYIQYAIARINSILRKAKEAGITEGEVMFEDTEKETRDLCLKIAQLNSVVMRAHTEKEPSIISDYAYTLAQTYSSFYGVASIMNANSQKEAAARLRLSRLVRDILSLLLYLLGIKSPEVMLKK